MSKPRYQTKEHNYLLRATHSATLIRLMALADARRIAWHVYPGTPRWVVLNRHNHRVEVPKVTHINALLMKEMATSIHGILTPTTVGQRSLRGALTERPDIVPAAVLKAADMAKVLAVGAVS